MAVLNVLFNVGAATISMIALSKTSFSIITLRKTKLSISALGIKILCLAALSIKILCIKNSHQSNTQYIDTQHNETQHNNIQHANSQHNNTKGTRRRLYAKSQSVEIKPIGLSVVMPIVMAPRKLVFFNYF
jgi:hypothetical protein